MGINFPNAPTLNQLYPQPPVVGLPVYKWDGEKWTVPAAAGTTKTPVYTDGSTPMTAQLKLFGSPPVATNDAAPKNYVDATLAGTIKADGSVPMTGQLTVQTPPVNPTDAASKTYVDSAIAVIPAPPLRSYLAGLTLSTAGSSTTFGVAAGVAVDSINVGFMSLASAYTKTTSPWAVGTGNGSFDGTGAAPSATSGWYHVWLIKRPDTGVVDVLTSLSATAPTMPANYTMLRRIGSMKTNASFQWIGFIQQGDDFYWSISVADLSNVSINTTPTLYTLSVPTGVRVKALLGGFFGNSAGIAYGLQINSPDIGGAIVAVYTSINPITQVSQGWGAFHGNFATNASAQVSVVSNGPGLLNIQTEGWTDTRGRDA
jgi:hypothetical protein